MKKPKGTYLDKHTGYLRTTTRGGKYPRSSLHHRVVTAEIIAHGDLPCFYPLNDRGLPLIPDGQGGHLEVHIHHMDHDRTHNCPCNLLIMDRRLHLAHNSHGQPRNPCTGELMTNGNGPEQSVNVYPWKEEDEEF